MDFGLIFFFLSSLWNVNPLPMVSRVSDHLLITSLQVLLWDKLLLSYCFQDSLFFFVFQQLHYNVSQCGYFEFIPLGAF